MPFGFTNQEPQWDRYDRLPRRSFSVELADFYCQGCAAGCALWRAGMHSSKIVNLSMYSFSQKRIRTKASREAYHHDLSSMAFSSFVVCSKSKPQGQRTIQSQSASANLSFSIANEAFAPRLALYQHMTLWVTMSQAYLQDALSVFDVNDAAFVSCLSSEIRQDDQWFANFHHQDRWLLLMREKLITGGLCRDANFRVVKLFHLTGFSGCSAPASCTISGVQCPPGKIGSIHSSTATWK